MFNLKSAFLGLFSAILISNLTYADEIGAFASLNNNPHTIYTTQGLKPISNSYKLAKLQFLPDLKDSENGWAGNNIGSAYNKNDCSAYKFTKANCTNNRTTYAKCPFNGKLYKDCHCNTNIYKYNQENCSYSGTQHTINYMLGSKRCLDDNQPPRSNECLCSERFIYTNNTSCGDPKKIIDESSSCTENNKTRYEKCKCNPEKYPYSYTGGNSRSAGFKNAVKAQCRNEENFYSCDNDGPTVYFNCAITDPAYKYTSASCQQEKTGWVISGSGKSISNGNGNIVTLYTICDCPSAYKSGSQCSYYMNKSSPKNSSLPFCYEYGHGKRDGSASYYDKRCIDWSANTLYSSKSCVNRAGITVYSDAAEDCLCDRNIYTVIGERCYEYHKFSRQWCAVCTDRTGTYSFRH